MRQQTRHKIKTIIKNTVFATLGVCVLLFGITLVWVSTIKLPDFSSFDSRKDINSTKIYDRTGTIVLYDLGSDINRTSIPYTDMGVNIKNATVAIEDANFYQNVGIEPKAMVRALFADITHTGVVQGGSTITQQVIKESLLSSDKTIVRKLKEVVLSLKLEREYSKDEILGIYLNEIPYGGNIYGIEEASQTFFGKEPADLTIAEAATLAAIPNAPTHYSPYGSYVSDLMARKNLVLSRMLALKFISQADYTAALAENIVFKPQSIGTGIIKAPHFVFYIKDYLEQKYGADMVESGGLKVITTLDYNLQQDAEKAVADYTLGANQKIPDENAGLVAVDPKTGQILAMVGSRNYFDTSIEGNFNVTTALRQPGSSFKPFVYVTAFEKGFTPETQLFDVPTEFSTSCDPYGNPYPGHLKSECYMPRDFDNKFRGPMSIRNALAQSINVPAVKTLYMIGIPAAIKTAQDMGVTTLTDPASYGLTLVLGGGEVKLTDMVSAYGAFATGGVRHPETGILSVQDKDGNVLESWQDNPVTVLPKNPTLQIDDILSDNTARTPTFGPKSALYFPDMPNREIPVKTGTTNDNKDSWAIGYTPSLVAGVWLGRNDDIPMPTTISAAPIWHEFMEGALPSYPPEVFDKPVPDPNYDNLPPVLRGYWQGNESFTVDTVSGKLATPLTPKSTQKEYVITDVHDILHWISKNNFLGGVPTDPASDPLYNNWETAVENWWAANSYKYPIVTEAQKPVGYDDVHTAANMPQISIASPTQGETFSSTATIPVTLSSTSTHYPIQKIDVFLNNSYVGTSSSGTPLTFSFSANNVSSAVSGSNTMTVVGTDSVGDTASASTTITLTL